jgi:UDP-N-acetylmuramoyl-tripeptide--D-alanyl-D-alanine ligase
LQVDGKQIKRGLENYKLPAGRCQIFHGIKNTFILDSSYNSSYVPAASSLTLLKKIASKRKIAILGDMRELGKLSAKEHKKLALKATETADLVITVGPLMQKYFNPEFTANKKSNQEIYSFDTTKEALNFIKHDDYIVLNDGDTILIKGSQNTLLLEIIVEDLLKNKKDKKYLCRRGKFYDNERLKLMN